MSAVAGVAFFLASSGDLPTLTGLTPASSDLLNRWEAIRHE